VLLAMGKPISVAESSLRISMSFTTTLEQLQLVMASLQTSIRASQR
jgi:cysteine sulfinate desulfinase/cysteine desulfurase-like protein